jgi:hypothetical protein
VFSFEVDNKIYKLYQCPRSLIMDSSMSWYKKYKTYKRFNNAPEYEKMSKLFIERCDIYESSLAELQGG